MRETVLSKLLLLLKVEEVVAVAAVSPVLCRVPAAGAEDAVVV
ncbi:MAG TPA: hypothetical protein VHA33_24860 [Candidatus Angelobacter sp.]|jgi:hypothetical protein|nr:hypothetical protein [Candidatus Angelobacter sp.]